MALGQKQKDLPRRFQVWVQDDSGMRLINQFDDREDAGDCADRVRTGPMGPGSDVWVDDLSADESKIPDCDDFDTYRIPG